MADSDEVVFSRNGALGVITLNRPQALNSLTLEMCHAMYAALTDWRDDGSVKAVLIKGEGRAFCAGGDIRTLYDTGLSGDAYPYRFYHDEYRLNALIHHLPKPYIALLDGIVMGGGVGVSVHGSHRVVTENTRFAMPETGIGLFPDVGGSYFLSRCAGELGMFLALTGTRIGAADALYSGIGTHYVPAARLDALESDLAAADLSTGDAASARVEEVLARHSEPVGEAPGLAGERSRIDRIFSAQSVDEIIRRLEQEDDAWADEICDTIRAKSPISTKVAFRQLRTGREQGFDACMRMEYRLACRFITGLDFYEGVRATVIDKDQSPVWKPDRLSEIDEAAVDAYFADLGDRELKLD